MAKNVKILQSVCDDDAQLKEKQQRTDKRIKTLIDCGYTIREAELKVYYEELMRRREEETRADERAKMLDEIKKIIATKTNPMYWIEKMVKEQK